jgi:hypothetical protein
MQRTSAHFCLEFVADFLLYYCHACDSPVYLQLWQHPLKVAIHSQNRQKRDVRHYCSDLALHKMLKHGDDLIPT